MNAESKIIDDQEMYNRNTIEREIYAMSNMEEKPPLIIECPHCHTPVIPLANNICPSCREDMSNMQDVDPNRVALAVHESEEFPSFCYSCNRYTERLIRVTADEESGIETLLFRQRPPESTSNIIIYLPECELCSELEVELVEVDYEHQTMKIMVHWGFQARVFQVREAQSKLDDENSDDDL